MPFGLAIAVRHRLGELNFHKLSAFRGNHILHIQRPRREASKWLRKAPTESIQYLPGPTCTGPFIFSDCHISKTIWAPLFFQPLSPNPLLQGKAREKGKKERKSKKSTDPLLQRQVPCIHFKC